MWPLLQVKKNAEKTLSFEIRKKHFLLFAKFTSQCLLCTCWQFSPYWLMLCVVWTSAAVKLTWSGASVFICFPFCWLIHFCACYLFTIVLIIFHFARESLAPSWCCTMFGITFLVQLFTWCVCCLLNCNCYHFCQKMDYGYFEGQ